MPGFTAYTGMKVIGRPKPGETGVVAAASNPVGSLVGQLAKLAGARAVGIAGGPEKCAYVRGELGFDAVVDHWSEQLAEKLTEACPNGIDVYLENVGGPIWQAVLPLFQSLRTGPNVRCHRPLQWRRRRRAGSDAPQPCSAWLHQYRIRR
jgi:NADPH-dependent curcumin reductase CurA